jgi:hypothetical protein
VQLGLCGIAAAKVEANLMNLIHVEDNKVAIYGATDAHLFSPRFM